MDGLPGQMHLGRSRVKYLDPDVILVFEVMGGSRVLEWGASGWGPQFQMWGNTRHFKLSP